MKQISERIDSTNINTIVTIIGIIIGVPSFIALISGNMTFETIFNVSYILLLIILLTLMYLNNNITKKYRNEKKEIENLIVDNKKAIASIYADMNQKVTKLEADVINLKDQVAKWKDVAASHSDEVLQWKSDCKMLFDWKQELELKKQHLQEELQHVYDFPPSLNPNRNVPYSVDVILRPSDPRDAQLVNIDRRLRTI